MISRIKSQNLNDIGADRNSKQEKWNNSKVSLIHTLPLRQPDEYWTHWTRRLVWFASIHLHIATGAHSEAVLLCFCFCLDLTSHHNGTVYQWTIPKTTQYFESSTVKCDENCEQFLFVLYWLVPCIGSCLQMNKPTAEHVERKTKVQRVA